MATDNRDDSPLPHPHAGISGVQNFFILFGTVAWTLYIPAIAYFYESLPLTAAFVAIAAANIIGYRLARRGSLLVSRLTNIVSIGFIFFVFDDGIHGPSGVSFLYPTFMLSTVVMFEQYGLRGRLAAIAYNSFLILFTNASDAPLRIAESLPTAAASTLSTVNMCISLLAFLLLYLRQERIRTVSTEQIRDAFYRVDNLVNNLSAAVWSIDENRALRSSNAYFAVVCTPLFGSEIRRGELLIHAGFGTPHHPAWERFLSEALYGGSAQMVITAIVDDSLRYFEVTGSSIKLDDGSKGALCVARDITDHHTYELELQKKEERLAELLSLSSDILFRYDEQRHRFDYLSDAVTSTLGYPPELTRRWSLADIRQYVVPGSVRMVTVGKVERADGLRERHIIREYKVRKADGSTCWMSDSVTQVRSAEGRPLYQLGSSREVTAQKEMTRELAELNDNLEQLVQARTEMLRRALHKVSQMESTRSRFLTLIAHQFRTPLTTILSSAELLNKLAERGILQEERRTVLTGRIEGSVATLSRLLDTIDRLTTIQRDIEQAHPTEVDLAEWLATRIPPMAAQVGIKVISVDTPQRSCRVMAAHDLLHKMIYPLLDNAARYGGTTVGVQLSTHGRHATIAITDNGAGINSDDLPKIFELFARGTTEESVGSIPGLGVGLPTAVMIAESLDGSVSARSDTLNGTTISISLPLAPSSP